MPVVEGAANVASDLGIYLKALAKYEKAHDLWLKERNKHNAAMAQYERRQARYKKDIQEWNIARSLGSPVAGRPINPGPPPLAFNQEEPRRPPTPQGLHHKFYQNRDGALPVPGKGQSYHEAQVSQARDGQRGQHRIVVLADDMTGLVRKKWCTCDHYGDNARKTRSSWTSFK